MYKRIISLLAILFIFIIISCEKKVVEVRYDPLPFHFPVLYDVAAPDSLEKGSPDTSLVLISVFDTDGPDNVDSVYFIVTRPDGSSNGLHLDMHDDGINSDSVAGDGRYTLGILAPTPQNQSGDYIFTFYAFDMQGNESNNPQKIVTAY
jgi:hypothetical protein